MPEVHLAVGICLIAANLVAGAWGGYSWLERRPSTGFWYALRVAQATVLLQAFLDIHSLPPERQTQIAMAIVRRDTGIMATACLVIFLLALRAAGTSSAF